MDASYFTVIAFDVADNKRRRRLVKLLEAFGERAQESVFEAWLNAAERKKLEARVQRCIQLSEDRIAFYALPKVDYDDIISLGQGSLAQIPSYWII